MKSSRQLVLCWQDDSFYLGNLSIRGSEYPYLNVHNLFPKNELEYVYSYL